MPEQDAVLAIIGDVRDMQPVLDNVWEHLLPAMHPEGLPVEPQAYGELRDKLAVLSLPLPCEFDGFAPCCLQKKIPKLPAGINLPQLGPEA